jgi:hypothetical protein
MPQEIKKEIPIFKTQCQEDRNARDLAIYKEYNELTSVESQCKSGVVNYLMKKYNIHSAGTIYVIRQRVAARLAKEQEATV